jgi:hypothetical protein
MRCFMSLADSVFGKTVCQDEYRGSRTPIQAFFFGQLTHSLHGERLPRIGRSLKHNGRTMSALGRIHQSVIPRHPRPAIRRRMVAQAVEV